MLAGLMCSSLARGLEYRNCSVNILEICTEHHLQQWAKQTQPLLLRGSQPVRPPWPVSQGKED